MAQFQEVREEVTANRLLRGKAVKHGFAEISAHYRSNMSLAVSQGKQDNESTNCSIQDQVGYPSDLPCPIPRLRGILAYRTFSGGQNRIIGCMDKDALRCEWIISTVYYIMRALPPTRTRDKTTRSVDRQENSDLSG